MTHCIDTPVYKPTQQGPWAKVALFFKVRAKRRADLANFKSLMKLHPDTLKDIGMTRGDITWAANLPIDKDASKELKHVVCYGAE